MTRFRLITAVALCAAIVVALFCARILDAAGEPSAPGHWVGTWTAAPQLTEPANMPPPPFTQGNVVLADSTLRQTVHVTAGGPRIRLRFSNAYGGTDLPITMVS